MTKVTYESGGSTQLAHFEYDALGRMISAQVRYDADVNAVAETTKFYYDGSNVIAEYDMADVIQRRYVHGKRGIDERAVMLAGNYTTLDAYYYLMEDLDTVAGLVAKNGALVETYDHDAYGKVTIWGYRPVDMDRDGDVFSDDVAEIYPGDYMNSPATNPMHDPTTDGTVDGADFGFAAYYVTSEDEPPVRLYASSVGNPYVFTGRRVHWVEADFDGDPAENKPIQYNRRRHYDPVHGRWLQRDPAGSGPEFRWSPGGKTEFDTLGMVFDASEQYEDGMNLYLYARARPGLLRDPSGLFAGFECCTRDQENELYAANGVAQAHIAWLHAQITTALARDDGQYPAFTALKLRRAKSYLNCASGALNTLKATCQDDRGSCGAAYAWVKWIFGKTIYVCPAFFARPPGGYVRSGFQGAVLVHEATHKCGTNDVHYFWQNGERPHDRGFGLFAYQDIASTYDTWLLLGFCIPGYDCL